MGEGKKQEEGSVREKREMGKKPSLRMCTFFKGCPHAFQNQPALSKKPCVPDRSPPCGAWLSPHNREGLVLTYPCAQCHPTPLTPLASMS